MNTFGIILGLVTLVIIGLGFVWVVRGERVLGANWWPYFLFAGMVMILASLIIVNDWFSSFLGIQGASLIWGSTELKEQSMRVKLGWYPDNPDKIQPPFSQVINKWPMPHL